MIRYLANQLRLKQLPQALKCTASVFNALPNTKVLVAGGQV